MLGIGGEGRVSPLMPGCQITYTVINEAGETIANNIVAESPDEAAVRQQEHVPCRKFRTRCPCLCGFLKTGIWIAQSSRENRSILRARPPPRSQSAPRTLRSRLPMQSRRRAIGVPAPAKLVIGDGILVSFGASNFSWRVRGESIAFSNTLSRSYRANEWWKCQLSE